MHPRLRFLRRQNRQARRAGSRRTATRGRGHPPHGTAPRGHHRRRPRRPARWRSGAFQTNHRSRARGQSRHHHRGARARFQRPRLGLANGDGRPPAHLQPQHRNRRTADAACQIPRPIPAQPHRSEKGQGHGERQGRHQERHHARPRRAPRGSAPRLRRPPRP